MLLWGKGRKKRARALKAAAEHFLWQAAISLAGAAATTGMRRRFQHLLRRNGVEALERAEGIARRGLKADPADLEMAIQYAEIAVARQQWDEAARRWKAVVNRHGARLNGELYERIHLAYSKDGNVVDADAIAMLIAPMKQAYERWCREHDTLAAQDVARLRAAASAWDQPPLISILLPCCDPPLDQLAAAIEAMIAQIYPHWELCVADDASSDPAVAALLRQYAATDARIKPILGTARIGTARSFAAALDAAGGEFCGLAHPRDHLAPHALLFVAGEIMRNSALDWIYGDLDHVDADGHRMRPLLRTGPDADLWRSVPHMGARAMYRTAALRSACGTHDGPDAGLEHELTLRMLERTPIDRIQHVRSILHHRRIVDDAAGREGHQMDGARSAAVQAVRRHLARCGISADVIELHALPGCHVRYPLPDPAPLVSIIIPTRDRLDLLSSCIGSLRERTDYPRYELIVVDNGSTESASLKYFDYLRTLDNVRVLHDPQPFNWSRLNNVAVKAANGSVLCLLNNDIEIVNERWLTELAAHAMRPEIGVVGAALWYPDGRLQHGGVAFQPSSGLPVHAMLGVKRTGRPIRARVVQSYSAVTGACLVLRKEVFTAAGGLDEAALPIGYSDVDLCLRIIEELGLRCAWTPFAELIHHESASRGRALSRDDYIRNERDGRTLLNRWYERMVDDPYSPPAIAGQDPQSPAYAGVRTSLNRYAHSRPLRLAFVHIPKTAGLALRQKLVDHFPRPSTLAISARTLLSCYEGDAAALARLRRRLKETAILFSHISYGFGELAGWDCSYATVLRSPAARVLSHYRHLFRSPLSPFGDTALAAAPLDLLVRKGVLPGNLMLRKILGEPPEEATWIEINAASPAGAAFSGFRVPAAAWGGAHEKLLAAPDLEPDLDLGKVERAMAILERDFAFVGRAEALEEHAAALFAGLGISDPGTLQRLNVAPAETSLSIAVNERETIAAFNMLDQRLYDRIAALPGGLFFNPARLDR